MPRPPASSEVVIDKQILVEDTCDCLFRTNFERTRSRRHDAYTAVQQYIHELCATGTSTSKQHTRPWTRCHVRPPTPHQTDPPFAFIHWYTYMSTFAVINQTRDERRQWRTQRLAPASAHRRRRGKHWVWRRKRRGQPCSEYEQPRQLRPGERQRTPAAPRTHGRSKKREKWYRWRAPCCPPPASGS